MAQPVSVVVFIPGITGSELSTPDNKLIWPATCAEYISGYPDWKFKALQGDLKVGRILLDVGWIAVYSALIKFLASIGYTEVQRGGVQNLYSFPYDWRQDNIKTARVLADRLDAIVKDYGSTPVAISILTHSMGTLVARYLLESGSFATRPGVRSISQLIMMAGPQVGAPKVLSTIRGQTAEAPLNAKQTQALANLAAYPSAYQLLPFANAPALNNEAAPLSLVNMYDPTIANALGLLASSVQSALTLQKGLDLAKAPASVRYFAFTGTQYETQTANGYSAPSGTAAVSTNYGGDGTVPIWSACAPSVQGQFVGESHAFIYKDQDLQDTLAELLPKQANLVAMRVTAFMAAPPTVDVSVRDAVVQPGKPISIGLRIDPRLASLAGNIVVARASAGALEAGPAEASFETVETVPYRSEGVPSKHITLRLAPVETAGAYRVSYVSSAGATSGRPAFFVVQMAQ